MSKHKYLLILTIFSSIVVTNICITYANNANYTYISKYIHPQIEYINIKNESSNNLQQIHVIKAPINSRYYDIDAISSTNYITERFTLSKMSKIHNSLVSVNTNFFSYYSPKSIFFPEGPFINSKGVVSLDSEFNRYNDSMATLSILKNHTISMDYWKTDLKLYYSLNKYLTLRSYNKPISDENPTAYLFDKNYANTTYDILPQDMQAMFIHIKNDRIIKITNSKRHLYIPQDGYMLIIGLDYYNKIKNDFIEGNRVRFNIDIPFNIKNVKLAVTGSSMLLKRGKIPANLSYPIPGIHPRTAIGVDKRNKFIYFVVVDGRQNKSVGISENDLGIILLKLNCYNAINFDGGGSSTLVSKDAYTNTYNVLNSPSDKSERMISSGLGILNK